LAALFGRSNVDVPFLAGRPRRRCGRKKFAGDYLKVFTLQNYARGTSLSTRRGAGRPGGALRRSFGQPLCLAVSYALAKRAAG